MIDTNFPTPQQMKAFGHFLSSVVSSLPRFALVLCLVAAGVCLLGLVAVLILRLLDAHHLLKQKSVFLELTPPAFADRSPLANQKFFSILHGLEETRSALDKLLKRRVVITPELVATREGGIRYVVCLPKHVRKIFERDMASYLSSVRIAQIDDYLPNRQALERGKVMEFRQTRDFAYPLRVDESLFDQDLVAYLMGGMTKLNPGETMVVQLVLSPTQVPQSDKLAAKVLHNEVHLHSLDKQRALSVMPVFTGISKLLFAVTEGIGEITHGPATHRSHELRHSDVQFQKQVAKGMRPARMLSSTEEPLAQSVYDKLSQDLFRVDIRVLVLANDKETELDRMNGMRKALGSFKVPKYQSLKAKLNFPYKVRGPYRLFRFANRQPSLFNKNSSILAVSEVAGIYHFPDGITVNPENVITSPSKTLPAPAVVKRRADHAEFDVVLGWNHHHGENTNLGLTAKEREKHLYIIGGTGNGKTTLMQYAIVQDIRNGKGVAVVDPHGDLAKTILKYIPKERIKDVVYLNPVDIKHPIGLNLLELPTGLDEDELLLEKGRVASSIVSVMRKVFSDDGTNAHRIEAVMRNAIHTALTVEDATLFTVLKLLRNEKFRKEVVSKLEDEDLKDFWQEEVGQAGDMQMVSMTKGVTQRIDRFNISVPAKRMLGQAKSTINFEDIMDSGKILICNLAHGEIEEDESALFGTTILAKLKMAAERRARMTESERKPFYVYVDEFQNFATTPFVKMLSSSRKYKLFLTVAEQSTKQQDEDRLTEAILSNVSTVVCFRTGSNDDEELMLHRFEPYVQKGEISNLPAYNFYIRIQAEQSLEPMSGETIVLSEDDASESVAREVVEASRETYATTFTKSAPVAKPKSGKKGKTDGSGKKGGKKNAGGGVGGALAVNDDS